jgi:hypothetical protein
VPHPATNAALHWHYFNAKYRVEKDHQDIGVYIPLDDEELKPLMTKP